MSECRVVDLKELGVSEEVFYKIYSMGEEDGRADAIADMTDEERRLDKEDMDILDDLYRAYDDGYAQGRTDALTEVSKEMRMLYGNEYEKKIRTDAIDELSDLIDRLLWNYDTETYVDLSEGFKESARLLKEQK